MSVEQRLKELNIELPKVGSPLGNYVHAKRVGNLLYLSGKGPESADGTMPRGASSAAGCRSKRVTGMPARWASC
jgi:enamine deaminase RidA (YjgF/YER057c/UK114 family)